jgi:tRNA modification GTPase
MSDTAVSVLTPAGSGAIATVEAAGTRAWKLARRLFLPASAKPLPETPELHRFWFGTLAGGDTVILAVKGVDPPRIEVHCHGGRRVVQWVVEQFNDPASRERQRPEPENTPAADAASSRGELALAELIHAPTLRTAAILLDQYHGAFDRAIRDPEQLAALAAFAPLGRHLVAPWKVAVAGPPNVGKSSLINALAGFQRSVVSEIAGTTRDVVTVQTAFDGWPVELADTAGLRAGSALGSADSASRLNLDPVELAGIALAERYIREADLVLWVMDTSAGTGDREPQIGSPNAIRRVVNKVDRPAAWDLSLEPDAIRVSALSGEGIAGLAAAIASRLVPRAPLPGAAVPFTPLLADLVERASRAATREEAIAFIEQANP